MAVQVVTQENMAQAMSENDIVVLEFWASWCAPCRLFTPVYEQAAQRNPDIFFGTVNTEEQKSMVSAAGIVSIPTLMIFRQSVLVFRESGLLQGTQLDELLHQVRNLDMTQVQGANGVPQQ